ncbi:MAG: chemotaxis protein CheW [Treponema sp.]|jgi:purine-binding chemotaxis protein CheW|nr:chemotaxis protein CheW [Treponema sp.]
MAVEIKDLAQVNAELQEQKERAESVDFKIITFSLAGKDYGVDIMNVKEIAKADKFTFVPNAASFVRGVYNLRGDIIPIIDLRIFFHLPQEKKTDGQENMLILRINDQVYGTIVDKIDKVVGINHESIQPPHPIFGDINIKYISGVVEKAGDLYIILDVIRIFGQSEEGKKERSSVGVSDGGSFFAPAAKPANEPINKELAAAANDSTIGFIKEALLALKNFFVTPLNSVWLNRRFEDWRSDRTDSDLQLRNAADAEGFLGDFMSPCTNAFWDEDYTIAVKNLLPKIDSNNIQVWNFGCGKGYETYSIACILKSRYPDANLKIWANDSDIMAISQAPNMAFDLDEVPEYCRPFMVKGKNGYSFNQVIKDAIVFEYHDVLNDNPLPALDIILARDIMSYFTEADQNRLIDSFSEKLKPQGLVIVGKNEEIFGTQWIPMSSGPVSAFMPNS